MAQGELALNLTPAFAGQHKHFGPHLASQQEIPHLVMQ
jgi:hypothetical protein